MSGDLISIRLLCVAAAPRPLALWQQSVAMASVPIEFFAVAAADAIAELNQGGVDICLLDRSLPVGERVRVIAAARVTQPTPLVAVCAGQASETVDGADRVLVQPHSTHDARRAIELCLRARIPTRVLVVDDSSTMRNIVRKILVASLFALEVHEANEGVAALNLLRNGNFDMVFLDYNMPGFNGLETLAEIKRGNPKVAVVMMTSTLENAIAERAYAAGVLGFLKKPFYPADVDALIERHFGLEVARK